MSATNLKLFSILLMVLLLTACGGGSGGDDTQDEQTNQNNTPVELDAVLPAIEPTGPVDNSTLGNWDQTLLGVGEFGPANQFMNNWRGILTFDISSIPAGATIISAELVANQFQVNGDPYFNLGQVLVDHIEMGPTMLGAAYDDFTVGGTAGLEIGTLSANANLGIKSVDITGAVERDVSAGLPRTQLRLRFQVENSGDAQIDNVFFRGPESPDNAFLKIRYTE